MGANLINHLKRVLRPFDTTFNQIHYEINPVFRKSSVLIPLFCKDGQWSVLLLQRSPDLRSHSGPVAFPGGQRDECDADDVDAALREAEEEVGLRRQDVTVIATLPVAYITKNNAVTSVVGLIPCDFVPKPNPEEVSKVFSLPLSRFFSDFTTTTIPFYRKRVNMYSYADNVGPEMIVTFGWTAMMCLKVALVVLESDKEYEIEEGAVLNRQNAFDININELDSVLREREHEMEMKSAEMISESQIAELFRKFDTRYFGNPLNLPPSLKEAGVLVPLFFDGSCWRVLLTLRPKHMRTHAGNVAFPGGRKDPDDSDIVCTALRESEEEIGLSRDQVKVIAVLPASFVRPDNVVTPVLGIIPKEFVPTKNESEVERVFCLPLARFLKKDYERGSFEFEPGRHLYFYNFRDKLDDVTEVITWGYTARTLMKVALVVYQVDDTQYDTSELKVTKDDAFTDFPHSVLRVVLDAIAAKKGPKL